MSRFVITIAPDNGEAADAASAQTTVRVDTSTGQTRITELTVRAADGGGLAPADLPAVDLELLIRALAAPSAIRALPTDAEAEVVHLATPAEMARAVEPSEVAAEPGPVAGRPAKRATGRRAGTGRSAATGKAGGRRAAKKAAAETDTGARAGRKAAAAKATGRARKAAAGERETRAYRRMPDPAEVLAAYEQAGGSITKLAQHYGVPRHTANGWARRLRGQGYAIGRS